MARKNDSQIDLFAPAPQRSPSSPGIAPGITPAAATAVAPATMSDDTPALAAALPPTLRLGTSSWSFPGWAGIVYAREYPESRLAKDGLAAYARHPLLRAVGIDRTFYAPITAETFAAYRKSVPDDFRFLVKAHDALVTERFANHPRYGALAGHDNPLFLDHHYAAEHVIAPAVTGLTHTLGVVLFQFTPGSFRYPKRVLPRFANFLRHLPRDIPYAVEVRDRALLTHPWQEPFFAALYEASVDYCYVAHPTMPSIAEQAAIIAPDEQRQCMIRWMLARDFAYEEAKADFAPFDQMALPDPATRAQIADVVHAATKKGKHGLVIVNNKAEGSSPLSVTELARMIVGVRSSSE